MRMIPALGLACGLAFLSVQHTTGQSVGSVSKGLATALAPVAGMAPCTNPRASVQPDVFPIQIGTSTSSDGKTWTVPGPIQDGAFAVDLFNDCHGTGAN